MAASAIQRRRKLQDSPVTRNARFRKRTFFLAAGIARRRQRSPCGRTEPKKAGGGDADGCHRWCLLLSRPLIGRRPTMRKHAVVIAVALGFSAGAAQADNKLRVQLSGYEETPNTLSSPGSAEFEARISNSEDSIDWTLSYRDIPTPVLQAHIHFGQRALSGGISIFLCTNIG